MRRFRGLVSSQRVSPWAIRDAKQPEPAVVKADAGHEVKPVHAEPKSKPAKVEFKSVHDPATGKAQLVDIYVNGEWRGSRGTRKQAMLYASARGYFLEAQTGIEPV